MIALPYRRSVTPWLATCALALAARSPVGAEMFALHVYETPSAIAARSDATTGEAYWASFAAFGEKIKAAGVLRGGAAFRTNEAVLTVQVRGGETASHAGAYLPATDQLGGYFVIEVANQAEAVRWAALVPTATTGAVEVRPYYPVPGMK